MDEPAGPDEWQGRFWTERAGAPPGFPFSSLDWFEWAAVAGSLVVLLLFVAGFVFAARTLWRLAGG